MSEEQVFQISKMRDDDQMVFGWASVAKSADGKRPLDWAGDLIDSEDMEPAVYDFVLKYRNANQLHDGVVQGQLVESVMFTKDKMAAMGIPEGIVPEGWWVGFHIDDPQVFMKVKDGTYKMFSIEGSATRVPVEEEGMVNYER